MGTPGDPLERMNRATYRFNDSVDRAVLRPVATGYRDHVPQLVQTGIDNFLEQPRVPDDDRERPAAAQDQGHADGPRPVHGQLHARARRPAGSGLPLRHPEERRGFRPDPRPLGRSVGPLRGDAVLRPVDDARRAVDLCRRRRRTLRVALHIDNNVEWALAGISLVHRRSELLPFDAQFDAAYDRYAFIRNAWLQRREYQVKDGDVPDDIPLDELEEIEDPAAEPEVPEAPARERAGRDSAARGRREQLRHFADPGERGDRRRDVLVTERAARGRGPRATIRAAARDPRCPPARPGPGRTSTCSRLAKAASPSASRRAASAKPTSPDSSKRPGPAAARAPGVAAPSAPGAAAPPWFSFSSRAITASSPVWSTSAPTSFLKLRT